MGREFTEEELAVPIPDSFDSRTQWASCPSLHEVRDQSSCGSCWAMGGIAAATDRVCIATHGKNTDRLSAEHLVGCCHSCGMGCNGGYPSAVWQWFKSNGVVTGGEYGHCPSREYPTPKCPHECDSQSTYSKKFSQDKHHFESAYSVRSVSKIQQDMMTYGPGEVSFTVYADFEAYKGGIYQHRSGQMLGGHAVRFVGWGEEDGVPYWTVANSWNEDWGEKGYFRIIRGQNECGIEGSYVAGNYNANNN